jgi:ribosome-binding protein aMBF1 (putative translation factor)
MVATSQLVKRSRKASGPATSIRRKKEPAERKPPKYLRSGLAIREWREKGEVPFTREELSAKIGKCLSTILRWETGYAEPRISDARQMERIKGGLVTALFARP